MADTTPRPPQPQVGLDTYIVMDHAVVDLADRRLIRALDPPAQLHLLASLAAQAETFIEEQVCAARDNGATWTAIGRLLGTTATTARDRYGAHRASCPSNRRDHDRAEAPMR